MGLVNTIYKNSCYLRGWVCRLIPNHCCSILYMSYLVVRGIPFFCYFLQRVDTSSILFLIAVGAVPPLDRKVTLEYNYHFKYVYLIQNTQSYNSLQFASTFYTRIFCSLLLILNQTILTFFKKQMHIEAATMLSFTEEEFLKALEWGNP